MLTMAKSNRPETIKTEKASKWGKTLGGCSSTRTWPHEACTSVHGHNEDVVSLYVTIRQTDKMFWTFKDEISYTEEQKLMQQSQP
jgi:hypothetical protein